jgi:hypothetical protein
MLWGLLRRARAEKKLRAGARVLGLADGGSLEETKISPEQREQILRQLNTALEAKDPYTVGHTSRVARNSFGIAMTMGLSEDEVEEIRRAASLHDVGKIDVPDDVLLKPGKLTDEEYALMKQHSAAGAELVSRLGDERLTAIVRSHHERWDGRGYPDGLAGSDIPLGARIIAVADTYDAITTTRSYRQKSNHAKAVQILRQEAGRQFDSAAVDAFVANYPQKSAVMSAALVLVGAPQRVAAWLGGWLRGGAAGSIAQGVATAGAAAVIGTSVVAPPGMAQEPVAAASSRAAHSALASSDTADAHELGAPARSDSGRLHTGGGARQSHKGASNESESRMQDSKDSKRNGPQGTENSESDSPGTRPSDGQPPDAGGASDQPTGSDSGGGRNGVGGAVDGVRDTVSDVVDDTTDVVDNMTDRVRDTVEDATDTVRDLIGGGGGGLLGN